MAGQDGMQGATGRPGNEVCEQLTDLVIDLQTS